MDNVNKSNKYKKKGTSLGLKKDQRKSKTKSKGPCYVCRKSEHHARDCRYKNQQKNEGQVNSVNEIISMVSDINAIQSKVPGC